MNKYSPKVGLIQTNDHVRYFEYALRQLNIDFQLVDSTEIKKFEFLISDSNFKFIQNQENRNDSRHSGFIVTLARSKQGQIVVYPVSSFKDEEVVVPALKLSEPEATNLQSEAIKLATEKQLEGSLEVIFSESKNQILKINTIPTQFSLWTLDGSITSIFENHIRGLLNLPLGSPKLLDEKIVTVNVVGGEYFDMYRPFLHIFARDPELRVHFYEKEFKTNECIGHVCVKGKNLQDLLDRAHHAADYLNGVVTE